MNSLQKPSAFAREVWILFLVTRTAAFLHMFFFMNKLLCIALVCICATVQSFSPAGRGLMNFHRVGISGLSSSTLLAKAQSKSKDTASADGYWEGDWVCADCGYIYDIDIDGNGQYFEEQKRGFICPQCRYGITVSR